VAALAGDVDPDEAVDALGSLVEKSLITVVEIGETGALYRLLDTTRAYALAKLEASGERASIAAAQASYLCELLERSRSRGGTPERTLLDQLGSVRASLEWSFSANGDNELATRLAAAAVPMLLQLSLLRECYRWVELALSILKASKRGTVREMELQAALGTTAMFTHGNGPEVRTALDRGIALADAVDDPLEQLRLLGALHILLTRTAEWNDSLVTAQRAEALAGRIPDDAAGRLIAGWMVATSQHLLGDQVEAELRCRTALTPIPTSRSTALLYFGFDHRIRALIVLCRTLWLLGRAEDALRVAGDALRDAARVAQPTTAAISYIYTFSVYLWTGDWGAAERVVEALIEHSTKHSLLPYQVVARGQRGQLLVKRGDFDAGIPLLVEAIETLNLGRHLLLQTTFYSALAEALAKAGRVPEALIAIDRGIAETNRNDGRSFDLPEMLRIKGDLLAADDGALATAEEQLLAALDRARQQRALGWEIRAATSFARLCSRRGRAAEGRKVLEAACAKSSQGSSTIDLLEARRLLADP